MHHTDGITAEIGQSDMLKTAASAYAEEGRLSPRHMLAAFEAAQKGCPKKFCGTQTENGDDMRGVARRENKRGKRIEGGLQ